MSFGSERHGGVKEHSSMLKRHVTVASVISCSGPNKTHNHLCLFIKFFITCKLFIYIILCVYFSYVYSSSSIGMPTFQAFNEKTRKTLGGPALMSFSLFWPGAFHMFACCMWKRIAKHRGVSQRTLAKKPQEIWTKTNSIGMFS